MEWCEIVEGRFLGVKGVWNNPLPFCIVPCEQTSKLPVLMHSFYEETQFPVLLYTWYSATALGNGEKFANMPITV
jgi:hypothetical protein